MCPECGETFIHHSTLTSHRRANHGYLGGFRYKCHLCSFESNDAAVVESHINSKHKGGVKPYRCDLCGRSYCGQRQLAKHDCEASPDRYQCSLCAKNFNSKRKLTLHKIVHSDERNFVCVKCNRRFKHRTSLNNHKNHCVPCPVFVDLAKS